MQCKQLGAVATGSNTSECSLSILLEGPFWHVGRRHFCFSASKKQIVPGFEPVSAHQACLMLRILHGITASSHCLQGSKLDVYAKQWRLFADCLNSVGKHIQCCQVLTAASLQCHCYTAGLVLELASPIFPSLFLLLACLGSIARAITGGLRSCQAPCSLQAAVLCSTCFVLMHLYQTISYESFCMEHCLAATVSLLPSWTVLKLFP